jgi:hypothetical protein
VELKVQVWVKIDAKVLYSPYVIIGHYSVKQCCGTVPFCLGSGSGSQIFFPRFQFRFLPLNLYFLLRFKEWVTEILVNSLLQR